MHKGRRSGMRRFTWRVTPLCSCDCRHNAEADDDKDANHNPCVGDM